MVSNEQKEDEIVLIERFGPFGRRQTSKAGFDGERNLSISCHDLRYLRRYLLLVGQWYPEEWNSTKRVFYHAWQVTYEDFFSGQKKLFVTQYDS